MMKKILFVCMGNTCRSPMAEKILKTKIKLSGIKGIKVLSAGLCAREGDKMSDYSKEALKILGYNPNGFKSRIASAEMLIKSDLIVCMTRELKSHISNFPNVYSVDELTHVVEISDPYGGDITCYIKTSHQIEDVCNEIIKKLIDGDIKL